jgi:hypothetical protein
VSDTPAVTRNQVHTRTPPSMASIFRRALE